MTAAAQERFTADLQHKLRNSVWVNGGCSSWYKDRNGNITVLWPGFTFNFRNTTRRFDIAAYDVTPADRTTADRTADAIPAGA